MTSEETRQKLQDITQKIVDDFHPDKVILFGSWAWGTPGPDSDVDLFVVKQTDNTRKLAREIDATIFPRPFPLDLIVCKPDQVEKRKAMNDYFIQEVLEKGTVLYAKDS